MADDSERIARALERIEGHMVRSDALMAEQRRAFREENAMSRAALVAILDRLQGGGAAPAT
ncbi:MAG: hypothetical protein MSC31_16000 [Solirubrobacteraceae bacterium MAG38_C4-C5]|nr:hypothetical protein [Candidatus Siliceabacter maunaloa]